MMDLNKMIDLVPNNAKGYVYFYVSEQNRKEIDETKYLGYFFRYYNEIEKDQAYLTDRPLM
jgi:hypothetical protein